MSNADNIYFCGLMLKQARLDAKQQGVKIPKRLSTYRIDMGNSTWFEVYAPNHGLLWSGYADCASHAKAHYIESLLNTE